MKYEFKINNRTVTIDEFFDAVGREVYTDDLIAEIVETGSATCKRSWSIDTVYQVVCVDGDNP
ncbi:hypothetical protein JV173_01510 [Acholeplasma equirhinis]|uniref:hypothetical protein n=1 Tax=Acholeplasma equirhinis TaxID=555393 RepID=UPI00197A9060|nr:hypothetical protein [Acholeplasma equirhinis]MBN3490181.1 hypothetical protein [Acholeplasma equirhinis]